MAAAGVVKPGIDGLLDRYSRWSEADVLENANRYPGPTGFLSYVVEDAFSQYVPEILPSDIYKAHEKGLIYIHKLPLSLIMPYCTGHSVERLLRLGLRTPTISARPARHLDTFVDHVANYLITMQHYFTGAQAFSMVEMYAGAFIRRDRLGFREVRQQVQRLVYNLNFPSRVGLQSPFTNLTVVLDAARRMVEEAQAVYAGGYTGEPLAAYLDEARLFLRALADVLLEGDASGRPFTFPIPTLMTTARSIWEDPELYEAVFTLAARRGSFYWLNTRVVDPDAAFAMCCRLTIRREELSAARPMRIRDLKRELEEARERMLERLEKGRLGGVWAIPDVTGSINVVTVNLPRLALMSGGEDDRFWELYRQALGLVRAALFWFRSRYVRLIRRYSNVYSMLITYMPEFPSTHFNTIGLIGLPEAAAILMQDPNLWSEGSRRDWLRAAALMRRMVEYAVRHALEWARSDGVPWNVEEVPGESAAAKLASKDAAMFPELLSYLPDPESPVYSTSIAPYYGSLDLWDRVEVEAMVQRSFTGGVMMHLFLGEEPDPNALAKLTQRLASTELVYWSYTPAITVCRRCRRSFTGIYTECPSCGSGDVEVWSRIVGYYRPLVNWNPARRREFQLRKHYSIQS